jgi:hypothetical protein
VVNQLTTLDPSTLVLFHYIVRVSSSRCRLRCIPAGIAYASLRLFTYLSPWSFSVVALVRSRRRGFWRVDVCGWDVSRFLHLPFDDVVLKHSFLAEGLGLHLVWKYPLSFSSSVLHSWLNAHFKRRRWPCGGVEMGLVLDLSGIVAALGLHSRSS